MWTLHNVYQIEMRGQETLKCPWFYCLSSELFSLTNGTNGFSFSSQNSPQVQMYRSLICLEDPSLLNIRALFTIGLCTWLQKYTQERGIKKLSSEPVIFQGINNNCFTSASQFHIFVGFSASFFLTISSNKHRFISTVHFRV